MSPMLKIIYTLFLGLLIALFVGTGIEAFYPSPKAPEMPISSQYSNKDMDQKEKETDKKFQEDQKNYLNDFRNYSQKVFIIALISSVIILIISMIFASLLKELADGVLLGGVFTLLYSIIRAIMSENSQYRFIAVSIGLIIAIFLGYLKFIKEPKKS